MLNMLVVVVLTALLRLLKAPDGVDETSPADFHAAGHPQGRDLPELTSD
ncbi:MAG: hypothetical protein ACJ72W_01955 [Actinoallomurus sp.]